SNDGLPRIGKRRNESVRAVFPVVFVPLAFDDDEDRTRATICDWFDRSAWRRAAGEELRGAVHHPAVARPDNARRAGMAGEPLGPECAGPELGESRPGRRPGGLHGVATAGPVRP